MSGVKKQQCDLIDTAFAGLFKMGICLVFALSACQANIDQKQIQRAGFQGSIIKTPNFDLQSWQKIDPSSDTLIVYIEGDGRAWLSATQPSYDPTPGSPVALNLSLRDPRPNVVYIARPCQYLINQPVCKDNRWWTSDRFAAPVIAAFNQAINQIKANPEQKVELIGFSGGGAIAVDLAAQRSDVVAIRTVAGNLDPELFNQIHDATPMPATVDPLKYALKINNLPQIHYVGDEDDVVTEIIAKSYQKTANNPHCVKVQPMKNVGHNDGWEDIWPDLLKTELACR